MKPKEGYQMEDRSDATNQAPVLESAGYKAGGKLAGKKAVITGGDSGIGAAAAIAFAKEGADVAILYYDQDEDAQSVVGRIEELGRKALMLKGDVGDEDFAARAVDEITERFGNIDVLVNNAGEQHPHLFQQVDAAESSILDITSEQLDRTFHTNIYSMFYMVKAALPHLNEGAAIINTTSVTAYRGSNNLMDYASTKGAIVSFTRSLATNREMLEKKIRVNAVAPGPVWTPLIPASFGEEHGKTFGKNVPMERPAQPYELAPAYVYLASEDSSYMVGQVMHLNGGEIING